MKRRGRRRTPLGRKGNVDLPTEIVNICYRQLIAVIGSLVAPWLFLLAFFTNIILYFSKYLQIILIHKPPSQVMMPGQVVGAGMMPGQVVGGGMMPGQVVGGGMMPGQVVGMAPQPQTMQVTLPPNFIPGQPMQVQTPAGTIITVNAPPGATGGQVIQVQY